MALKVDMNKELLQGCINQRIASLRREINKPGQNPAIKMILEKDIDILIKADASITEVK